MSGKHYTDEFKVEAAKQVIDHGRPVGEVAARLGGGEHPLAVRMGVRAAQDAAGAPG